MQILWVKIQSWHAVKLTRSLEDRTLCGRTAGADAETSDLLPAAKSCETCLRIVARRADG
jgi:hypothetical protein